MQKTCIRESYALSPGGVLSSMWSENGVSVIKKLIMKPILPMKTSQKRSVFRSRKSSTNIPPAIIENRPEQRYYSVLVPSEVPNGSYIYVARDIQNNVLRITMVNMAIYEFYLFAFGLPADLPKGQIIIFGHDRSRYIPCRSCDHDKHHFYDYEVTVPINTSIEVYMQQILDDLDEKFHLDVCVEQLSIVKDSRPTMTEKGESVELIWEDQPTMIMRSKSGWTIEQLAHEVTARI